MIGKEAPAIANCALLRAAEDIVTLPPIALRVDDCVVELPTFTLPKLSAVGAMVNCPTVEPVPVSGTFKLMPVTKTFPPAAPVACGVKVTFSVILCPARSDRGRVGPLTEKLVPVIWNAVSDSLELLALVNTTGSDALLPTVTEPKERLEGEAVSGLLFTPLPPI